MRGGGIRKGLSKRLPLTRPSARTRGRGEDQTDVTFKSANFTSGERSSIHWSE